MATTRTPTRLPTQNGAPAPALEQEALGVLSSVRTTLQAVLSELPVEPLRPRDLEQGLGIHKTLAWRVMRVAHGRDPLADAQYIPGAEGMEIFLAAAKVAGARKASIEKVRTSVVEFQSLVSTHAGDRPSLEVMLRSMTEAPEPAADLRAPRRAAFKCASYTWGSQTLVHVLSAVFSPAGDGLCDLATLRGHVGIRLVRREARPVLSRTVESATDRPGPRAARVEAVEPEGLLGGVPLLRDFCTKPLPALEAVPASNNNVDYRFADQEVGARGAITAYTAEIRRGLPGCLHRDASNTMNALMLGVRRPIQAAVVDMWIPPNLLGGNKPRGLTLCAMMDDPVRQPPSGWRRLPMAETAQRLGRGLNAAALDSAPEYSGAIGRVFERLGWDPEGFELHRLSVEFPVMGTSLALVVDLPE